MAEYKGKSTWIAFIDVDEYIMPGTAVPGTYDNSRQPVRACTLVATNVTATTALPGPPEASFAQWLASLSKSKPKVDHVYLRWVFYPVPLTSQGSYFASPGVFLHNFRFSDEKIARDGGDYRNTGKSLIRPEFFTGESTVHMFYPNDFKSYTPSERRIVPSTAEPTVLPENCSLWEDK